MTTETNQPAEPASSSGRLERDALIGVISAGSGYALWGLSVIFYKQLTTVPPFELLAHRTLWSLVLAGLVLVILRRGHFLVAVLKNGRHAAALVVTALIIASNWFVFIYSINESRVLETSLGYYINPLISVLIGVWALGERLTRPQMAAAFLAFLGVANMTWALGDLPWISLFLAASFALYGYLRKILPVGPLEGLLIEMAVLTPAALIYLDSQGAGLGLTAFESGGLWIEFLLVMTGPMTAVPLILFNYGAQRIRLATLGLMQYMAPTTQFALAVWLYGEVLTNAHIVTFALIWVGLGVFSFDSWRVERRLRRGSA